MNKWKNVRLGTIAEFKNGMNFSKDNFGAGSKIINVKDFQDYSYPIYDDLDEIDPTGLPLKKCALEDNDILFVRSNGNKELIGRSIFIKQPPKNLTHSAFTIRARFTSDKAFPRFFAYLFRTNYIRSVFSSLGNGTNISNLNQQILDDLLVPLPPLEYQYKVVDVIQKYDDLIENNTRRIAILEESAQRLYREWFVHFRFPGHEKVKMVDAEIGLIPKGWRRGTLAEDANITMGQSPPSTYYNEIGDGFPFHQGVTGFTDFLPEHKVYSTSGNRFAEKGDILFSVRAPVGRINIADQKLILGRGISSIRSKNGNQAYLLSTLKNIFVKLDIIGNGAVFNAVTKEDMQNIPIFIPCEHLMKEYNGIAEPIYKMMMLLCAENANLRWTRDLLLPQLISGRLDVSELDIKVA